MPCGAVGLGRAPRLLAYELTAVLRKKVHRQLLEEEEADAAFAQAMQLAVELIDPDDLHRLAWELARRFRRPTAYDSHYLALAELVGCPFWTTDEPEEAARTIEELAIKSDNRCGATPDWPSGWAAPLCRFPEIRIYWAR